MKSIPGWKPMYNIEKEVIKEKEHGLFTYYLLKGMSGDADINKDKSINNLFDALNNHNIKVKSMRNESNRLEELFIDMIKK